ncbi:hypothetical protein [Nocardia sp. BMG111209]|uniref:hypothetical protein n=1 Tax=Nocardia sp. BMG111209 TaxID=1160137 RepID=UPI00037076F2|nr:hypothetical protein [Nocardia sp. BMG111209]
MAEEEIGRETAAALRTTLQVAGLLAEHWNRRTEARAREAIARHETAAREATARWHAERRTAETYLRTTGNAGWWQNANRSDLTEAWCTARQWAPHSVPAANAEKRLTGHILDRYGVDLAGSVTPGGPADPAVISRLLERAAWRRAAAHDDDLEAGSDTQIIAAQKVIDEALHALVAEHASGTHAGSDNPALYHRTRVAEAGLRALGEPGAAWLREFDCSPHLAYARVLVAPDTATRLALYDTAHRLQQIDNTPALSTDERAARITEELAAIEELGEPGRRWLDAWRNDPEPAYDRVLNNQHIHHDLAARTEKQYSAQQRAAEAALRGRTGEKWFATAGRTEILDAWDTARTWREQSTVAAGAFDRINSRILERFGVDLTSTDADLDQVATMIDHAAWRVAAAKMDTAAIAAAHAEAEAQQRSERDQLYELVNKHAEATDRYRTHGDNQLDKPSDAGHTQPAATIAAAETRLRDLGPAGERWLRDFDTDPHRAYARVLVGPNTVARRHLHAAVQQLRNSDLIGPTRTPRLTHEQAVAAVEAAGETGQRWLSTWHAQPEVAIARILEDPYTTTEITQTPVAPAIGKIDRGPRGGRGQGRREHAPRIRTATWTAADLEEARAWLGKHDPEWLSVRAWKLRNMPGTAYGRHSVHESIVDRHRRATHPDPAVRETVRINAITDHNDPDRHTAIRTQLDDRGVSPAMQRVRMNLEQDNAVPLNAVVAKASRAESNQGTTAPDLALPLDQDLDHER